MMKGILIDVTKCTGCESCVEACRKANGLEPEIPLPRQSGDDLSSRKILTVLQISKRRFARKQCMHCENPACAEACLVGGITKTKQGPVIYDPGKCIGCRYCMLACPLAIPRYEWDKKLPFVKKCDMCFDRLLEGSKPACVEACPHEACSFGDRHDLLERAKQTVSRNPEKYLQHVYGDREMGGTSVMYITDVPLHVLGWPGNVGERTIRSYTWLVISKTPYLGIGTAALLGGTYWIVQRRMKLQAEKTHESKEVKEKKEEK